MSHQSDTLSKNDTLSEHDKIDLIRKIIRHRGNELREKYPILKQQNFIGMSILILAVSGVLISGWAYWRGHISAWLCIPLVAFFTSFLHELEHDLIHWQYFKKNKAVHHFMLLTVWAFRPGTINPWIRRRMHLLHHKTSGTAADIEERGIGNGQKYNTLRWFVMFDTFTGNLVKILLTTPKDKKLKHALKIIAANFPFAVACAITWYGFLLFHLIDGVSIVLNNEVTWSAQTLATMHIVNNVVVVLIAPFYLRSLCLNFISSNMHYYGDVHSVLQQTQVLNAWYFWPLQLFCFNFGSTHGIHHFVVGEPFYIRQLTAPAAHSILREQGIRFNDLGTFKRNNRYQLKQQRLSNALQHT